MSDAFWIALFATIPSLASLAGVIYSIRVSHGNSKKIDSVATTVNTVQEQTNHMSEQLVASSKVVARAEGKAEGVAQERNNPTPQP